MFLPGGKTPRFVGLIQWLQTGQPILRVLLLRQSLVGVFPEVEEFAVVIHGPGPIPLTFKDSSQSVVG